MPTSRLLTIVGLADLGVALAVLLGDGSTIVAVALALAGVGLLAAAAFARPRIDPERARRHEAADAQRLADETAAEAESLEDRPPPSGA